MGDTKACLPVCWAGAGCQFLKLSCRPFWLLFRASGILRLASSWPALCRLSTSMSKAGSQLLLLMSALCGEGN